MRSIGSVELPFCCEPCGFTFRSVSINNFHASVALFRPTIHCISIIVTHAKLLVVDGRMAQGAVLQLYFFDFGFDQLVSACLARVVLLTQDRSASEYAGLEVGATGPTARLVLGHLVLATFARTRELFSLRFLGGMASEDAYSNFLEALAVIGAAHAFKLDECS